MNQVRITVYIRPDQKEHLDRISRARGDFSEHIRKALDAYMAPYRERTTADAIDNAIAQLTAIREFVVGRAGIGLPDENQQVKEIEHGKVT